MRDGGRFKERYDFSLDSRQLGLVLFAALVAASLLFVLGMSVGRQWERKMAGHSSDTAMQEPPPAPEEVIPAAPPVEPAKVSDAAPVPGPKPEEAAVKEQAGKEPAPEPMKPEELTFPKVLAGKGKNPPAEPRPAKKARTEAVKGRFTVQVGAYKDKTTADELSARLKKHGYSPGVHITDGAGGSRVYKVHVGSFSTKNDAQKMADKLALKEKLKPYVTSY